MTRARCRMTLATQDGKSLAGASVYVYQPNGTTPIAETMYDDITGGNVLTNPLMADANSSILFYLDAPKRVDLMARKTGYADLTIPDVPVMLDAEDTTSKAHDHTGGDGAPIPTAALAADVPRLQLGVNNGQEIWQRGTGPFTANDAYTSDRHQIVLAGTDTLSISRESATKKANSQYAAKGTFVLGTGAGGTQHKQRLVISDGYHHLLGQAVSLRKPLNANAPNAARAFIRTDGTGGTITYSNYHPGDSTWVDLDAANVVVPTDATYVEYGIAFAASVTVYEDNTMPVGGSVACDYQPLHPAEEWAKCQRYYEVLGEGASTEVVIRGYQAAGQILEQSLRFAQRKAVLPTCTKVGTWIVANCAQPGLDNPGYGGVSIQVTATVAGTVSAYSNTSAYIIAEANP